MAAGLGFKTFTTGEVLTAADVNGYLMQGVLVFASAAARNAAITSPQEGQFAFTKDTNGLWYYDGAAWVASGATGDIEGVTAGVGITGGGTSGTVTITNDMATTITAAGDIVVGTGSGTYDNLPIGTTNQILTADTTVSPYKVKWATPATTASGLTLINTTTFSSVTSVSIDSLFSSTYDNYQIVFTTTSTSGGADIRMKLRSGGADNSSNDYVTSASYMQSGALTNIGGTTTTGWFIVSNGSAIMTSIINLSNPNLASSTKSGVFSTMGGTNDRYTFGGFYKQNATQFTGLSVATGAATMTGQISIYGLAK